jgi:hypothetical protein
MSLARQNSFPPYLFARTIVEEITNLKSRKGLTDAMRHPLEKLGDRGAILEAYQESENVERKQQDYKHGETEVDDAYKEGVCKEVVATTRLALEVMDVIQRDPMNGPKFDAERNRAGIEHEILLQECLHAMGIPFETEEQLRDRGSSRTPDILLSIPVGVKVMTGSDEQWKVVCWMDSKALFGDEATHKEMIKGQAESYVHRFGPGLVLYWFGHAPLERLDDVQGDVVVWRWKLPEEFMLPSGEMMREGQTARSLLRPAT